MRYVVEIKVLTEGTTSDTMRSIRQTWEFGDNGKFRLAGEAYAVEETANLLSASIRDGLKGADDCNLNDNSGTPHKA